LLQYQQPVEIPVPRVLVPARPAEVNFPAVVTFGPALIYLLSDNDAVKVLALKAFSFGGAAWLSQSVN
jgi:hypothetical protein